MAFSLRPVGKLTAEAVSQTAPQSEAAPTASREVPAALQSPGDRSLDQWRGLALLLVLISHGFFYTGKVPGIGRTGVNLFFFISGILVFRSLAKGPQETSRGARHFWYRRIKRLLPAMYFYLFCMVLLVLAVGTHFNSPEFRPSFFNGLPSAFLYYKNYYTTPFSGGTENLTGHLWSLACEMQFYLLAPIIFFAGGRSVLRRFVVFGTVLIGLLAGGLSVLGKSQFEPYTFGVAAWPMMAGFFAEFLRQAFPQHLKRWGRLLVWCGALSLVVLVPTVMTGHKKAVILAGTLLVAGCLGSYLRGIAPRGFIGDGFHFLGNRTYSIYLWQQPLTLGGLVPALWHPLGSLLAIPLGTLSFHFFERPFMSKYGKPRTKSG